jgi:hypothetical protein
MDTTMDRMADLIKDTLLDGMEGDDEVPAAISLAPVSADELIERLRPCLEQTLREVADRLNAVPGDSLPDEILEETGELFSDLWAATLRTALQMRIESALAEEPTPPDAPPPQGEWAKRYRHMHLTA